MLKCKHQNKEFNAVYTERLSITLDLQCFSVTIDTEGYFQGARPVDAKKRYRSMYTVIPTQLLSVSIGTWSPMLALSSTELSEYINDTLLRSIAVPESSLLSYE
jgi:hypothetical protein